VTGGVCGAALYVCRMFDGEGQKNDRGRGRNGTVGARDATRET